MRIDTTKRLSHRELETSIREYIDPIEHSFQVDQTIEEVLFTLQAKRIERHVEYFFVTDKRNILRGMLTLADILYNSPGSRLEEILDSEVIKVYEDDSLERGLKIMFLHQVLMVPVVNGENRLVGVLEILPTEETQFHTKKVHYKNLKEDLFQFIGFSIEQKKSKSPWTDYRYRMPWLTCNLIGGLICAVISELLKLTLIKFVILAFFIPLVLTLSESISIQSMTLSLRFLHLKKIPWGQVWKRIFWEARTSFLLALSCAVAITFFYLAWSIELLPIISISISVIVSMMVAALLGALFPVILHTLHLDPKVAAGPVILMITDIMTIGIYLGLATLMLM